jgi:hypothetical protein
MDSNMETAITGYSYNNVKGRTEVQASPDDGRNYPPKHVVVNVTNK